MTTSQKPSFLTEILEGVEIPVGRLSYFRTQLRYDLHEVVLREFLRQEDKGEITQADLARRIHRKPSQISKLLGAPGNWTINTVSDLLLGMKVQPVVTALSLEDRVSGYLETWGDSDNIVSPETLKQEPVVSENATDNG
jgi:hypothetical protein